MKNMAAVRVRSWGESRKMYEPGKAQTMDLCDKHSTFCVKSLQARWRDDLTQ